VINRVALKLRPNHVPTLSSLGSALFTVGAWKYRNTTGYLEESAQMYTRALENLPASESSSRVSLFFLPLSFPVSFPPSRHVNIISQIMTRIRTIVEY
jgi:hypothetical protein